MKPSILNAIHWHAPWLQGWAPLARAVMLRLAMTSCTSALLGC